jgi:hypothetical protein
MLYVSVIQKNSLMIIINISVGFSQIKRFRNTFCFEMEVKLPLTGDPSNIAGY